MGLRRRLLICYLGGAAPLKLTWLSVLHTVFGGSVTVGTALIYTIISDVLPKHERLAFFFQVTAATIATQFLGSLISAALMLWDPWIPMLLGLGIEFLGILALLFIPETLSYDDSSVSPTPDSTSALSTPTTLISRPSLWRKVSARAHRSLSFLTSDIRILLIVSTFHVHMLFNNRDVMLQHISARYNITLAYATALVSIRSGLAFLLCVIVLPIVNLYSRNRFGSQLSDLVLTRISAVFLSVGFLGVGLAPNLPLLIAGLVINSLSWGLFSFLRSLSTSLVEAHHVARLNSLIGVIDTAGLMVGSPLLAILFTWGMDLHGQWSGLPFLVCAGVVAILTLILTRVSV
ncbi:major facilitator superfamily domain-containing protein [Lasiosphaeria ovina]|uniref:Major facilitator superfamily domain-containing protein n=1 Tax=Lasiosphaeria ovina TaxID=92902 RepID=A0AAE0JTQ3_9PEZI|nr:major facilitator superfamily domain-containing protein [Lasiosphaeria ovina]